MYFQIADGIVNRQIVFGNEFGLNNIYIFESTYFISKKIIQNIDRSLCTEMFITILLIIGKTCKQPNCLTIEMWLNKS